MPPKREVAAVMEELREREAAAAGHDDKVMSRFEMLGHHLLEVISEWVPPPYARSSYLESIEAAPKTVIKLGLISERIGTSWCENSWFSVDSLLSFKNCRDKGRLCLRCRREGFDPIYRHHPCGCNIYCHECVEWAKKIIEEKGVQVCFMCSGEVQSLYKSGMIEGNVPRQIFVKAQEEGLCFSCQKGKAVYVNHPCSCTIWCEECTDWGRESLIRNAAQKCAWCSQGVSEILKSLGKLEELVLKAILRTRYGSDMDKITDVKILRDYKNSKTRSWGTFCFMCSNQIKVGVANNRASVANHPCGCIMFCLGCAATLILKHMRCNSPTYTCLSCRQEVTGLEEIGDDRIDGRRSDKFYKEYMTNMMQNICIKGDGREVHWGNYPCRCPMWCNECHLDLIAKLRWPHQLGHCHLCNSQVQTFLNLSTQEVEIINENSGEQRKGNTISKDEKRKLRREKKQAKIDESLRQWKELDEGKQRS